MRRVVTLGFVFLFLAAFGRVTNAWANQPAASDHTKNKTGFEFDDMDVDTEVDKGEDDDTSDESTESSKSKGDSDDTYEDNTADQDDFYQSHFKEDADDSDTEVDNTDNSTP